MAVCKYFGECGGCALQHISYETQLQQKKDKLVRLLGNISVDVIPSSPYEYRNRMDFIFTPVGLGFRRKHKWHSIVDIDACPISSNRINAILQELRTEFSDVDAFDLHKKKGVFRYAVIRTATSGAAVSFVLNQDSMKLTQASEKIEAFAKKTSVENIVISYVPENTESTISSEYYVVKGSDMLMQEYLGKKFFYSVQGFFQNNHEGAESLQNYCRNILKKYASKNTELLDLYAGVGTFGIINADQFKNVICIESFKECIDATKINIKENAILNISAHVLDAKQIKKFEFSKDLVVLTDPPRSGMHRNAIDVLNKSGAKAIMYISCNMDQLARELPLFSKYTVVEAAICDLFPQTHHTEAIVVLTPRTP